ncbi:MAG: heparinase II/III family protein [Planctomycetota bacterium]
MRTIPLLCLLAIAPALAGGAVYPQVTHRPRLTFDGRDAAHTQRQVARINAQQEPWASAYRALRQLAETGSPVAHGALAWKTKPDKWNVLYAQETRNGRIAAAQAQVAWLYAQGCDPAWLPLPKLPGDATPEGWVRQRAGLARQTLEGMYDAWPCWRGFGVINRGIVMADALIQHCVAYDLLAALPPAWRGSLGSSERRLVALASDVRQWFFTIDPENNNHSLRVASALGVAALTLNTYDRHRWWKPGTWYTRPKGWLQRAERTTHPTRRRSDLRHQARTGAWAEGSSYYRYALDLVLPYAYAYERTLSREPGRVKLLRSDTLAELMTWPIDLRRPDGKRPQVDNSTVFLDALPAYFANQLPDGARSAADRARCLWDVRQSKVGLGGSPFLLAAFDPTPAQLQAADLATAPDPGRQPTRFLPDQGAAVLRTDWGPDAAHVLVQAQHGELRTHGTGHESVDNGAYTFFAHGEALTIDPGYFGFSQVTKTNRAEHRSLVLVDGEGPKPAHQPLGVLPWRARGEDAHLKLGPRTQAGARVRSAEVESRYRKATIERTLALVDQRYLVVEDRCSAKKTKTYTTQVQANAGARHNRPLTVSGLQVRYQSKQQAREVAVGGASTAALSVRTSVRESRTGDGAPGHEAIEYSARGKTVRFLTAVAVAKPGAAAPLVRSRTAVGDAIALQVEVDGAIDVIVSNPGGQTVTFPAQNGAGAVRTSQALAIVSFVNGQGQVLWATGSGTTTLP